MPSWKSGFAHLLSVLLGVAIGVVFTSRHFWKRSIRDDVGALVMMAQKDMAVLSEIKLNDSLAAQYHLEGFLASEIQELNVMAKDHGEPAIEAHEMQKRIAAWRSRHPAMALTPSLNTEVENAIAATR